jgi:hypothetical protein
MPRLNVGMARPEALAKCLLIRAFVASRTLCKNDRLAAPRGRKSPLKLRAHPALTADVGHPRRSWTGRPTGRSTG